MKDLLSIRVALCGLVGVFLTACAHTQPFVKDAIPATPIPAKLPESSLTQSSALKLTGLPDSNLPRGSCGMVLWTLDARRPVPILRYVAGESGEFRLSGVPYELLRLNVGGDSAFGIFPVQSFAAGTDIRVDVELQFGQGFDGGTYLERGVISVAKPDFPTLITPVAGIAGCRSQ